MLRSLRRECGTDAYFNDSHREVSSTADEKHQGRNSLRGHLSLSGSQAGVTGRKDVQDEQSVKYCVSDEDPMTRHTSDQPFYTRI